MEPISVFRTAVELRSYRAASEDRAAVVSYSGGIVLAVADGVGGRRGGAAAADLAVRLVRDAATRITRPADPEAWRDLLFDIDQALHADPDAGETTLVVVSVSPEGIVGATVGDSEAWLVSSSAGHSPLTGTGRRKPYLGYGMAVPIGLQHSPPSPTDTLLLATDGLFKYADPDRIAATASGADFVAAAAAVAELPRNSAGSFYDDVAVVLCRVS